MIQVFSEVSQSLVTFLSRILLSFLGSLTAENTVLCFLEHGSVGLCLCLLDCLEHGMAGLCFLFNRNHDTINLGTSAEHNSTLVFETFGQGTEHYLYTFGCTCWCFVWKMYYLYPYRESNTTYTFPWTTYSVNRCTEHYISLNFCLCRTAFQEIKV